MTIPSINKTEKGIRHQMDFTIPIHLRTENKRNRFDREILGCCQRTKKKNKWSMRVTTIRTNCSCCSWNGLKKFEKNTVGIGNKGNHLNCPHYTVVKFSENTQMSTGDVKKLSATQTPVKKQLLSLM